MKQALSFFEKAIRNNRLAHLYLISGPKGSKKNDLALEVAIRVLEKENEIDYKEKIKAGNIANVFIVEKDGELIKKEQIQALQQEFSKTALVEGKRIFIIKNIEKISNSAANSLLKFLEEPESDKTLGLLLTENIDDVLATIRSRSQIIHLKSMEEDKIKEMLLKDNIDIKAATLAPFVTKDIEEAKSLAEDEEFLNLINVFEETIKIMIEKSEPLTLFFAKNRDALLIRREVLKIFIELLILYFLDIIYYKTNQEIKHAFLNDTIIIYSNNNSLENVNEIIFDLQTIIMEMNYFVNLDLTIEKLASILNKGK